MQRLLCDGEYLQQGLHGQVRLLTNEIQDAMVHAPQPALGEDAVGPTGELPIREIKGLDGCAQRSFVF